MIPVYQIRGVVCNSFDNLCVEEDNFAVRKDQVCHNNSQPMAEQDMCYRRLRAAGKELVKTRRVDHKCS